MKVSVKLNVLGLRGMTAFIPIKSDIGIGGINRIISASYVTMRLPN